MRANPKRALRIALLACLAACAAGAAAQPATPLTAETASRLIQEVGAQEAAQRERVVSAVRRADLASAKTTCLSALAEARATGGKQYQP